MQAILARRAPDVDRSIRGEFGDAARMFFDFPDEDRGTAFEEGAEAIRRAVRFLQSVAGVPHSTFLPYRYSLVVLARLFAHYPDPDDRTIQLLRRWFWRLMLVGPEFFPGNESDIILTLNQAVRPADLEGSVLRLLGLIPKSRAEARYPIVNCFARAESTTRLTLCSWWSMGRAR